MIPFRQFIAFTFAAAAAMPVLAADIVLMPPAGGGVSMTNAAGDVTKLRVADEGAALAGNLTLENSTPTAGNILKGLNRFIHNYGANTFVGELAGNFTMTGGSNTVMGALAFQANTTGSLNTVVGRNAMLNNTTGSSNTASGVFALANNTTGSSNTASGHFALLSNTTGFSNTASGVNALRFNNGSQNTASGDGALFSNTTGFNNTASGHFARVSNTTGSQNTAIGQSADVSTGNLTNATAIGFAAVVNASNKIRLGNGSVTVIEGQVAYTFSSDRNKKENLRAVDARQVLEKLRTMSVTSWNYIGHDPAKSRHYGPMAQDFFAAFGRDEMGQFGTDTTINSGDITAILMVGLQGLDAQVRKDRRTIEAQATEIAALKVAAAEIASLKAAVANVEELRRETARMARLLDRLDRQMPINSAAR